MHRSAQWLAVGLVLALGAGPAAAGTSGTPEITDIAGDANAINGQGQTTIDGRDTRPASADSADLRAVWFETSFKKTKIIDPSTGTVTHVRHTPAALLVNVQTTAPIHPAEVEVMRPLRFDVNATLPGSCSTRFRLLVGSTSDGATLETLSSGCPGGATAGGETTTPTYSGNVATYSYPLNIERFAEVLKPGTTVSAASAEVSRPIPFAGSLRLDEAAASTATFTFGDGAPADIDCTVTPDDPDCQP